VVVQLQCCLVSYVLHLSFGWLVSSSDGRPTTSPEQQRLALYPSVLLTSRAYHQLHSLMLLLFSKHRVGFLLLRVVLSLASNLSFIGYDCMELKTKRARESCTFLQYVNDIAEQHRDNLPCQ